VLLLGFWHVLQPGIYCILAPAACWQATCSAAAHSQALQCWKQAMNQLLLWRCRQLLRMLMANSLEVHGACTLAHIVSFA
jgi:hypothetical protein